MTVFLTRFLVCFFAGALAGTGISCSGISAAVVIAPLLAAFAGISPYEAIGIGLAADTCAAAFSARTWYRKGYVDTINTRRILLFLIPGTLVGSAAASLLPERTMGSVSLIVLLLIGVSFLLKKDRQRRAVHIRPALLTFLTCYFSFTVGLSCGFLGNGGGMIVLLVLTLFLGYDMHKGLGTSIYLMTFIALAGCVTHFIISGLPDLLCTVLCVCFTVLWSGMTAGIVNRVPARTLNRVAGGVMVACSMILLAVRYFY